MNDQPIIIPSCEADLTELADEALDVIGGGAGSTVDPDGRRSSLAY